MANVQYSAVTQRYPGADAPTVDNLDLDIADGEFLVLVGPSGCGKSTTLRVLAGLEPIESGRISIGDVDVTHLPPRARDVAMVFQNYALYPNMTVAAGRQAAGEHPLTDLRIAASVGHHHRLRHPRSGGGDDDGRPGGGAQRRCAATG